jgi:DNA-binding beta-propeller fold protein YncE
MKIRTKAWLSSAVGLPMLLYLTFHAQTAATRTETNSLAIAEVSGVYTDTSRSDPAPGSKLYWADVEAGAIRTSDIDGKIQQTLVASVESPYGMAFDVDAQALLWTSAAAEVVQKIAVSGGKPRTLATAFEEPYAVDITDISAQTAQAYLAATASTVYRNTFDLQTGEETSVVLAIFPESQPIHGLALDAEQGILYVGDINGRMTRKISLSDSATQDLIHTETEMYPGQAPGDTPVLAPIDGG